MESLPLKTALATWKALKDSASKPSTRVYHAELVSIFDSSFPGLDTPTDKVTSPQVAQFVAAVSRYSSPRFNALMALLRTLCPHLGKLPYRPVQPKQVKLPNPAQFAALLGELDKAHRGWAGLSVRFVAMSGLRIGEARHIRWEDVQPECLVVPATVTKNGKPRSVPYLPGMREVIERLRHVGPDRETILPHATFKTALAKACQRAGIGRLTHHDMRRLFGTRCVESGVDLPTTARWMGHQDGGALLAKTYFHLLDGHSRDMAQRVTLATEGSDEEGRAREGEAVGQVAGAVSVDGHNLQPWPIWSGSVLDAGLAVVRAHAPP